MSRRPASPARPRPSGAGARRPTTARAGGPGTRPAARPVRASDGASPADGPREPRPARLVRLLSVRALVLAVVLLSGFTLLLPTVRGYLGQQAELDALALELEQAVAREKDLGAELDRWDDEAYVVAQARERLAYVRPGETSYRVIDPEVVEPEPVVEGAEPGLVEGPALPLGGDVNPWYATVWESVRVAGEADVLGDAAGEQE